MYHLEISLPILPKSVNQKSGRHWQVVKQERDKIKNLIAFATTKKRPSSPLKKAYLVCTRFSSVCPDYDGLVSTFKHVIDGLVEAGILEDDSMDHIGMPEFHWKKAKPKEGHITVVVEEFTSRTKPVVTWLGEAT